MSSPTPIPDAGRLSVYLSYAPEDLEEVRTLHAQLLAKGFSPWAREMEGLGRGPNLWEEKIHESHAIVVCLSRTAVAAQGRLLGEIDKALGIERERRTENIFLIPIQFGPVDKPRIPFGLRNRPIVDLRETDALDRILAILEECRTQHGIQPPKHESDDAVALTAQDPPDPISVSSLNRNLQTPSREPESAAPPEPPSQSTHPQVNVQHLFLFGSGLIALIVALAFLHPHMERIQWLVMIFLMAIAAGAIGASIPGTLGYEGAGYKATGAAVLIFFFAGIGIAFAPSDKQEKPADSGPMLSAKSLDFGQVKIGQTSKPQTVTVTASEDATATIGKIAGPYLRADQCGDTIAKGAACTLAIAYKPTTNAPDQSGSLKIASDAKDSPQTVTVTLTGQASLPPPSPPPSPRRTGASPNAQDTQPQPYDQVLVPATKRPCDFGDQNPEKPLAPNRDRACSLPTVSDDTRIVSKYSGEEAAFQVKIARVSVTDPVTLDRQANFHRHVTVTLQVVQLTNLGTVMPIGWLTFNRASDGRPDCQDLPASSPSNPTQFFTESFDIDNNVEIYGMFRIYPTFYNDYCGHSYSEKELGTIAIVDHRMEL